MFYVSSTNNGGDGLANMMDIPGISMSDDNTPMAVTAVGSAIAPSLGDFLSDRPFHTDQLAGGWFVEASLAENAAGTRADPVIVRDGNHGRLAPVFQAADQDDPKGAVAAEIIIWLMSHTGGVVEQPIFRRGDADGSGGLDITDAIFTLNYLFLAGAAPTCMDTADADDSGGLDVTDAIYSLNYQFQAGSPPPAPGPTTCGVDPTDDDLAPCVYDCK